MCGSLVVSLLTMAGTEAEMQLRGTDNEYYLKFLPEWDGAHVLFMPV